VPEVGPAHALRSAPPEERLAPRRPVPQGLLVGAGVAVLLVLGGVAGWLSGRGHEQPAPDLPRAEVVAASTVPSRAAVDWASVLDGLDDARAEAFAAGDLRALDRVYAAGAPGLASDTALLQPLAAQRQTAHGLRHEVRWVDVLGESASAASLRVVDVLAAYEVRDAAGAVLSRAPARGEQPFLVELTRTAEGWRLVQVRPEA
jgi:hypothetical protein